MGVSNKPLQIIDSDLLKQFISRLGNNQLAPTSALLKVSQKREFPVFIEYGGLDIRIDEGVFPPDYFYGLEVFTPWVLERIKEGYDFCEIGCGVGITSLAVAKKGVNVVALDINSKAIQNIETNAGMNGIELIALESDILQNSPKGQKYDIIYWNMPFGYVPETIAPQNMLEKSLLDPGYNLLKRLLETTKSSLKESGELLIGTGTGANFPLFHQIITEKNYTHKLIKRQESQEVEPITFELYSLKPLRN